ncbi:MAG: iron-sulfur cluster assembly accessory protein [Gammaproteobacteria bacterium]|nr:iron-sulfur cluster assembly accessory protein [Gammaproteobacteria bacterium]
MSAVSGDDDSVTMTDTAIEHVRTQLRKRGTGKGLRLGVTKVGCSGYAYVVDFLDEPKDGDREFAVAEDFSVFVDVKSWPYVKGTRLDFKQQGLNAGFEFHNPNAASLCGCGESFNVELA